MVRVHPEPLTKEKIPKVKPEKVHVMTVGDMLQDGRVSLDGVQKASRESFFRQLDWLNKHPEEWDKIFERAKKLREDRKRSLEPSGLS